MWQSHNKSKKFRAVWDIVLSHISSILCQQISDSRPENLCCVFAWWKRMMIDILCCGYYCHSHGPTRDVPEECAHGRTQRRVPPMHARQRRRVQRHARNGDATRGQQCALCVGKNIGSGTEIAVAKMASFMIVFPRRQRGESSVIGSGGRKVRGVGRCH